MTHAEFGKLLERRMAKTSNVLASKASEYATDDRLHNFKVAAALQGITASQALMGMLAKHLVSVADMVGSKKPHDAAAWDEKLGDAINYLILLEAVIVDCGNTVAE